MSFTIAVKIEGLEKKRRSTGLIHVIVGFYLLLKSLDLYNYLLSASLTPVIPFLLVGAVSLFYGFFRKKIDLPAKHNPGIRLLQTVTFFSFAIVMIRLNSTIDYISLFIWSALTLVLFFSEKKVFKDSFITISEAGLTVPGTYNEHLVKWEILEDVVVRNDFITIFHKDKKYLQFQVLQDLSELELVKMNSFCRENLERI